jgi:hypothetical protein
MKKISFVLLILCSLVSACATPSLKIVDVNGSIIPYPNYTLQTIGEKKLRIMYYVALTKEHTDIDGVSLQEPIGFLTPKENLYYEKDHNINFSIQIINQNNLEYSLWENIEIKYHGYKEQKMFRRIATSNCSRKITKSLPFNNSIKDVSYYIIVFNKEGKPIAILDTFKYNIT